MMNVTVMPVVMPVVIVVTVSMKPVRLSIAPSSNFALVLRDAYEELEQVTPENRAHPDFLEATGRFTPTWRTGGSSWQSPAH
jgi:hypothetical protein